jgi:hypothetical protein
MSNDLSQRGQGTRLGRRGMLGAGVLALGATAGVASSADAAGEVMTFSGTRRTWGSTTPTAAERHVLNRFTYGFSKKELGRLRRAGGATAWFEKQLNPASVPEYKLPKLLSSLPDLYLPAADQELAANSGRETALDIQQQRRAATMARRVYSNRQVEALMEDFWTNHFYVNNQMFLSADYDRALRAKALGTFEDLLLTASLHPSMLAFLSTNDSTKSHPNENQAREVMELHTLGFDGGYTETDVAQVSRLLTGWRVTDEYLTDYDPTQHWTGPIKVLGWSNANASADGREATRSFLRYLAHHPSTARFVCRKLAVRFVSDNPSDALVTALAKVFLDNGTQIKPVLRAIFHHSEFASAKGKTLRTPMEDCVGLLRATGLSVSPAKPIGMTDRSAFLSLAWAPGIAGQPILGWSRPNGWPDVASAWDGPSRAEAMLKWHWMIADPNDRMFDGAGRVQGTHLLPRRSLRFDQYVDHISRRLLGMPATDRLVQAACAATGYTYATTVNRSSVALNADWPRLLVSLFDSPNWLWK